MPKEYKRKNTLNPIHQALPDESKQLIDYMETICVYKSRKHIYPSIASSVASHAQGQTYWRKAALRLIAQQKLFLKEDYTLLSKSSIRIVTAQLLLLYYMSCDTTLGPMLVLENLVPGIVQDLLRSISMSPTHPNEVIDVDYLDVDLMELSVPVDYLWYLNEPICRELFMNDQMGYILPLGAQSMRYVLKGMVLPRSEIEEYDAMHSVESKIEAKSAPQLPNFIAESRSYQQHLLIRILVSLLHTCTMQTNCIERKQIIQDGAVEALAILSIQTNMTESSNFADVTCLLDSKFVLKMAVYGLSCISMDELRRVALGNNSRLIQGMNSELYKRAQLVIDTIIHQRSIHLHTLEHRLNQSLKVQHTIHDSKADLADRLTAVPSAIQTPNPITKSFGWSKGAVVEWICHANDVSQDILASFNIFHSSNPLFGECHASLKERFAAINKEREDRMQQLLLEKKARVEVERMLQEFEQMAREDKPLESEYERKERLLAKKKELDAWQYEAKVSHARKIQALRDAKLAMKELAIMRLEDFAWLQHKPASSNTNEDEIAYEKEQVDLLRLKLREEKQRDAALRHMRLEDSLARQRRSQEWDVEEFNFRIENERQQKELLNMRREEDRLNKRIWKAIDEAEDEKRLQIKLDERKKQRATERRKRRQMENPKLYEKEWEKIPLEDDASIFYYYNHVTGDVQWEDPTIRPKKPHEAWEATYDDHGQMYYYNTITGQVCWNDPRHEIPIEQAWTECYTSDGIVYYFNAITGQSVWAKPSN